MPAFDLQGGLLLLAVRAASVCALLSVFGALVFREIVAPRALANMETHEARACRRILWRLVQASAAVGLAANFAWLCVQAANMADAQNLPAALAAVPEVMWHTLFGHVLLAQSLCLALTMCVVGVRGGVWRQRGGLGLATLALCLQAGHGHAWSMYDGPSFLLACDMLHLLGAGAWLGGLLPLLMIVWRASPRAGAIAARWFSPLGQWCIGALVVSASWQSWVLIGTVPGLVGTGYGWMALGKLALFGVLLGFAYFNRYKFAPALVKPSFLEKKDHKPFDHKQTNKSFLVLFFKKEQLPSLAQRTLLRSLTLQTCAALAIVFAASVLSELPPAMHDQPVWPFAQRFSLDAVREDPDFRREVFIAGTALGGACLMLAASFIRRRWRGIACGLAAITAWFALPHLDLLLVPAYPTSFYRSPTGFSADSIVQGQTVYAAHCVACHGADGRGNGPGAAGLPAPPADLTAAHLWMHSDGEVFWWLSHGIATPEGEQAMPGFAHVLDEDARWAVIDFIRARNAGVNRRGNFTWAHTVQAPDFGVTCGATMQKLSVLQGRFVLLRFGALGASPPARESVTVVAGHVGRGVPSAVCVTDDDSVAAAYAVVSGLDRAHLTGSAFLIDGDGWLRAMQPAGARQDWSDNARLAAAIAALKAQKIGQDVPMKMPM